MRSAAVRLVLASTVLGAAGCFSDRPSTGPTPPPAGGQAVQIFNFAYVPPDLTVRTGSTVTWTNDDDAPHTVSSDDNTTFDSGVFDLGMTFQFTAGDPGTFTYFCRIHPFMRASLTVTE